MMTTIEPGQMITYLRYHGWKWEGDDYDWSAWAQYKPDGIIEVSVPLKTDAGDYALRVAELLDALAIAEGRSSQDIRRDIEIGVY